MSRFIYNGKQYTFTITNSEDCSRLMKALDVMKRECPVSGNIDSILSSPEKMKECYRAYYKFFDTLFPGNVRKFIGYHEDLMNCLSAFNAFSEYLEECKSEMKYMNRSIMFHCGYSETSENMTENHTDAIAHIVDSIMEMKG